MIVVNHRFIMLRKVLISLTLVLSACGIQSTPQPTSIPFTGTPRSIIIDTDMAADDWMAIEDAVVLARCLSQEKDLAAPLNRYEAERKPRTTWMMNQSRVVGRLAHLDNSLLCRIREFLIAVVPERLTRRQFEKAINYEA